MLPHLYNSRLFYECRHLLACLASILLETFYYVTPNLPNYSPLPLLLLECVSDVILFRFEKNYISFLLIGFQKILFVLFPSYFYLFIISISNNCGSHQFKHFVFFLILLLVFLFFFHSLL